MKTLETPQGKTVYFVGPPLEEGPLPALFYFALSGEDSLQKAPFNQPVQFLEKAPLRIFSMTLPGHENNLPPENAITVWAKDKAILPAFFQEVKGAIEYLKPHYENNKVAVAGLSRGAFVACHVAAICSEITTILGFAPLTELSFAKEFQGKDVKELNLEHQIPKLKNKTLRFYIGNCDTRVGTENAFSFVHKLAKAAQEAKVRSPPIELIISPSIGFQGHGTGPDTFQAGTDYLKERLL